uniref:glutathione transferase n=1 Tax=Populus trichocarpa TaxID=3694 RepID=D2X9U1_POPTR|nr:putative phi class glutathione transferase GSTF9 [Populus trichocarpa]
MSTCTARVLLCLSEKGLEYDWCRSTRCRREPISNNLIHLPFGQIPAFEDFVQTFALLSESRAICKYLLRSSSFTESSIVDEWMEAEAHRFIIGQIIVIPAFQLVPDEKVIGTELEKLGKVLDVYEERLSKCRYLAGHYTMADMNHIPCLFYFMKTPYATAVTSRSPSK